MRSKRWKAAVIGWPAGKSRSPELYARLAKLLKRPFEYERVSVPPHGLVAFVDRVRRTAADEGWVGFNVTIPHKETVLRQLDSVRPVAKSIGAVNVVLASRRRLIGDNTDADGFMDALAERGVEVAGLDAVLFGAGGASRAVCAALGQAGARRVHLMNRSAGRAFDLAGAQARRFPKVQFTAGPQWPRDALLWVNATPLGMEGFPNQSPLPEGASVPRGAWVYDLVYRPAETPFLRRAAVFGARTIGGADMLVYQALRNWELWFEPLGGRRRRELKSELMRRTSWL